MKTVHEILESNDNIEDAIDEMRQIIEASGVNPMEGIQALERFAVRGLEQIGILVLQVADELGALPEGVETEYDNLRKNILFHKLAAVIEVLNLRPQGEGLLVAKPTLVVPS